MTLHPYLIFRSNGFNYGVDAYHVQEIFFLPEISPLPESPPEMVGVINLRGTILPILDLNRHLGYGDRTYHLRDNIIILASEQQRLGILVEAANEIELIGETDQNFGFEYLNHKSSKIRNFVVGIAQLEIGLITLLDPKLLVQYGWGTFELDTALEAEQTNQNRDDQSDLNLARFFPNATPVERQILIQRATELRESSEDQSRLERVPLAVIRLEEEYFGFDLKTIYEFTAIQNVTPIPCCPAHIVGNVNLRGEILTLVDLSGILELENGATQIKNWAIVVRFDQLVVGVMVDEVLDVIYLPASEISPLPTALDTGKNSYIQGIATYYDRQNQNRQLSLVDFRTILAAPELIVDEIV